MVSFEASAISFKLLLSSSLAITSSGKNVAGEKYNLTCTVLIDGLADVSWNYTFSDEIISNGTGTHSTVLQFDPLLFSHQDTYTCLVKIADITVEQTFYLTVMSKQSCTCVMTF